MDRLVESKRDINKERRIPHNKFKVGDKVVVIEDDTYKNSPLGTILTVKELLNEHNVSVNEHDWVWPVDWIEKIGDSK